MISAFIHLLLPGAALVSLHRGATPLGYAARAILWSLSLLTLFTFLFAALGIKGAYVLPIAVFLSLLLLWRKRNIIWRHAAHWPAIVIVTVAILLLAAYSLPFVFLHQSLPTGDSQKSIIWASQVISSNKLPDYSQSQALLNRDGVDFLTPGLHTLTASVMSWSLFPLSSVGYFSILAAISVAIIAAALARLVFPNGSRWVLSLTTAFLLLTQFRFLRYLREPGYHYQNIFGEIFLFGALFLGLSLLKKWNWPDMALALAILVSLSLTHQFSTFMAGFALLPVFIVYLFKGQHRWAAFGLLFAGIIGGIVLRLHKKLGDIFNLDPHLASLAPNLLDYPRTIGATWLFVALAGLVLFFICLKKKEDGFWLKLSFGLATLVLLLLSQGPRFGVDIPPIRALYFFIVPGSIMGAFAVDWVRLHAGRRALAVMVVLVLAAGYGSTSRAYNISHDVRTNSTLQASQIDLADYIQSANDMGAVLIDDYNRRSASWLVLSGKPMFARIAADLSRQMAEAKQSSTRYDLYLHQLQFEKIFSLGSWPEAAQVMETHNIDWVTGINKRSFFAFDHNPNLVDTTSGGDITLFERRGNSASFLPEYSNWLIRNSTLVNDIGDNEDTFEHLPASLRATRLSDPEAASHQTWRTTSAPIIPLKFNVEDFVEVLWDQDNNGMIDANLELLVMLHSETSTEFSATTSTGFETTLESGSGVVIEASQAPIEEDGFVTIYLHNPAEETVSIDLIALGLSKTL